MESAYSVELLAFWVDVLNIEDVFKEYSSHISINLVAVEWKMWQKETGKDESVVKRTGSQRPCVHPPPLGPSDAPTRTLQTVGFHVYTAIGYHLPEKWP